MTDPIDPQISDGFACNAQSAPPPDFDLSEIADDDMLSVERLVAAMLSDKHSLSSEELMAFAELFDASDCDLETVRELLLIIWNINACVIDLQWEKALRSPAQNSSGKEVKSPSDGNVEAQNMLSSEHRKLTKKHKQAAAKKQRRKGHHDSR